MVILTNCYFDKCKIYMHKFVLSSYGNYSMIFWFVHMPSYLVWTFTLCRCMQHGNKCIDHQSFCN